MPNQLTDKVAIVTGGSSGIGRAAAIELARAGAKVVVAARRTDQGEATVAAITGAGGTAVFHQTDVTEPDQVKALVERAVTDFGGLHIAFNNAGTEGTLAPFVEDNIENVQNVFAVNVKGLWLSMKYEVPAIVASG